MSNESNEKSTPITFKQLCKALANGDAPRGLKVQKNEVGGYTFSYGPKNNKIAIVASSDEVAMFGLKQAGLKLS